MPIIYDSPYTPNYGDLVDEVISFLQGYAAQPDQVAVLASDITSADTTISLTGTDHYPSQCLVEIGDELIMVLESDQTAGTLTALPQGRGWRSTAAAAHTANDTVTISPLAPRGRVKKSINDVIIGLYPMLFAVKTQQFTYNSVTKTAWEITDIQAEDILDVRYQDVLGNWQRIRHWEAEREAYDTTSGHVVRLPSDIPFGRTVQIVYSTRLSLLTDPSAPFTDSGVPESARDLLVYGAVARLLPALDASRMGVQYVSSDALDAPRPIGSAMGLAKEVKKLYDARLIAEQQTLSNRYPARKHYTR